jgi:hypothetical protein
MIECANPNCSNRFIPKTVSNKYCGAECRSETTNNNLKEKYYANKDRRNGKLTRKCKICKITTLSRYNKDAVCEPCQAQHEADARNTLLRELGAVA